LIRLWKIALKGVRGFRRSLVTIQMGREPREDFGDKSAGERRIE